MSNVIQFPPIEVQLWQGIEMELREGMASLGADQDLIEWVASELRMVFMKHCRPIEATADADQISAIREIEKALKTVHSALFGELMRAYIRIYKLEKYGKA